MNPTTYRKGLAVREHGEKAASPSVCAASKLASRALVAGAMLLPLASVAACDNGEWGSPVPYGQRVRKADAPKNAQVRELAKLLGDAGADREMVGWAVESANRKSEQHVQLLVDFSALMSGLGMRGEDIYSALIQLVDPSPERSFTVGRGPTRAESARLASLLERAAREADCDDPRCGTYSYGFGYVSEARTLTFTQAVHYQE